MATALYAHAARIVVLGGGPAGLAVARLLHLRGIPSTVLERDEGPHARTQGGSLDLGEDGGQRAVHEMRLSTRFAELARPMGQRLCLMDTAGKVLVERGAADADSYRPEIDRVQLRAMLLDSIPADTVRWGAQVDVVTPLRPGVHRIVLRDGTTVDADLVIGCDGIGSRARPLVTDARPRYTGVTFLHADITRPRRDSFIARHTGEGALFAVGENKAIMAQRNGDGSIRVHFALRTPEDPTRTRGDELEDTGAVRARLLSTFAGWSLELLTVLEEVEDAFSYWPLYSLPPRQQWAPHSGITLVGDAAHIMPPFTGEGVNMALLDAVDLVRALHDRHRTVDEAITEYEHTMLARMGDVITAANATGDLLLSPAGPAALLRQLTAPA